MTIDPGSMARQEDWPKFRSWDIRVGYKQVQNLEELLRALGVAYAPKSEQISKLRWFITLPSYVPAPELVKRQVEDFLR